MKKELSTPYMAEDFPIIVKTCGRNKLDRIEDAYKALHEAIEIKYFYEGTSTLLIGSESYTAHAGDTVVINPYEFHATINYGEVPGKYYIIMIEPEFFENMGSDVPNLRNLLHAHRLSLTNYYQNDEKIADILKRIVYESESQTEYFRLSVRGLMLELLAILLRTAKSPDFNETSKHVQHFYEIIEPALRKIRDCYPSYLSVEMLANACNVSKYYFCHVFKSVTNISPMAYLLEYRLRIADALLAGTSKTVSQIASESGFRNENYFSRCYKKHFGTAPGKKRKII